MRPWSQVRQVSTDRRPWEPRMLMGLSCLRRGDSKRFFSRHEVEHSYLLEPYEWPLFVTESLSLSRSSLLPLRLTSLPPFLSCSLLPSFSFFFPHSFLFSPPPSRLPLLLSSLHLFLPFLLPVVILTLSSPLPFSLHPPRVSSLRVCV